MENEKLKKISEIVSMRKSEICKNAKIEILDDDTSGKLYGGWKPICVKKNSACVNSNC